MCNGNSFLLQCLIKFCPLKMKFFFSISVNDSILYFNDLYVSIAFLYSVV